MIDALIVGRQLQEQQWRETEQAADDVARRLAPHARLFKSATDELPRDYFLAAFYSPERQQLLLKFATGAPADLTSEWCWAASSNYGNYRCVFDGEPVADDYVKIAFREGLRDAWEEKQAASTVLKGLGQAAGLLPSRWSKAIPGVPGALTGTLGGALIGAGLGYGAGWLGEKILPQDWQRGRLRRTLALMGGAVGAMPGALATLHNYADGRPLNSDAIMNPQYEAYRTLYDGSQDLPDLSDVKYAASQTGWDVEIPDIPLEQFQDNLWSDPYVARDLPLPTRAAASGLVGAAWRAQPEERRSARLVSPADIARISAGMGTGYLSGAIVGKALGALTGMPAETQDRLKRTGLWAGVIANVVPFAFGAR